MFISMNAWIQLSTTFEPATFQQNSARKVYYLNKGYQAHVLKYIKKLHSLFWSSQTQIKYIFIILFSPEKQKRM